MEVIPTLQVVLRIRWVVPVVGLTYSTWSINIFWFGTWKCSYPYKIRTSSIQWIPDPTGNIQNSVNLKSKQNKAPKLSENLFRSILKKKIWQNWFCLFVLGGRGNRELDSIILKKKFIWHYLLGSHVSTTQVIPRIVIEILTQGRESPVTVEWFEWMNLQIEWPITSSNIIILFLMTSSRLQKHASI